MALDDVLDLSEVAPLDALRPYAAAPAPGRLLVIACGGDGTFNWLASCVATLAAEQAAAQPPGPRFRPDLVVCPLGTGNDLARSLGWGAAFPGFPRLAAFVAAAAEGGSGRGLDLWSVRFASGGQPKVEAMHNYLSLGVDAEVAARFHTARVRNPERFSSQRVNKLRYALSGVRLLLQGSPSLHKRVEELLLDGRAVEVPKARAGVDSRGGQGGPCARRRRRTDRRTGGRTLLSANPTRLRTPPAGDEGAAAAQHPVLRGGHGPLGLPGGQQLPPVCPPPPPVPPPGGRRRRAAPLAVSRPPPAHAYPGGNHRLLLLLQLPHAPPPASRPALRPRPLISLFSPPAPFSIFPTRRA